MQAVTNLAQTSAGAGQSFHSNVAATMRNLTTKEANHAAIVRTPGAVKLLVDGARSSDPETREHVAMALHNLCVGRGGAGRSAVGKQNGLDTLVELSEGGSGRVRTFCGLALQSLSAASPASSPAMAARLVACMLAIKEVDDDEPLRIVPANLAGAGARGDLLRGRTTCMWDDEPEPTWSYHVSLQSRPFLISSRRSRCARRKLRARPFRGVGVFSVGSHSPLTPFFVPLQIESLLDLPRLAVVDPTARAEGSNVKGSDDAPTEVEKPKARMLPHDEAELIAGNFTTMLASVQRVQADPTFLRDGFEPTSPLAAGPKSAPIAAVLPPIERKAGW